MDTLTFSPYQFDLDASLESFLHEDLGDGDHSALSCIPASATGKARLLVKDSGILAGMEVAQAVFQKVDPSLVFEPLLEDGATIQYGDEAFYISGSSRSILMGERLALNLMQRMSAIATKTNSITELLKGTKCKVLDTRKTTPGIRWYEKMAVRIGGGTNHRFGLYDMVMIKDNHIDYAGGIAQAVERVVHYLKEKQLDIPIEVESRNLAEVEEILATGKADRIMLDNFSYEDIRKAVALIGNKSQTEASGGITPETVREYALCGVDYVSMGALTHSIYNLDLSLKAVHE